ncbi:GntR family transcriptional regulator [Amaricoccus solimangrovi]|uniref:GntR family transcriptional regulator n=1 Tax=Amaricoccus solimangrovi TaxID=2589815 RepID=A0A501WU55_9RHOB|nr:GntR family transcriptional regulator [Amaricoccus solimangrovi]TPE51684.1 GntR family transcriptional regulator [Amaricoccus solimangrovi]
MADASATNGCDAEPAGTQSSRAVLELRNLIVGGHIPPEERLTEVQLSERLGMSRTPIRAAIQQLRAEGLLEPLPGGGFHARAFGPAEIAEAIELRGMIEGFAARLLAERGIAPEDFARLGALVAEMDALFEAEDFGADQFVAYGGLNARFHAALASATGSALVVEEARRANARPFAAASALVRVRGGGAASRDHLLPAQDQHRAVLEAIRERQGARAEAIMREHARHSERNLMKALRAKAPLTGVAGAGLIRRPA